MTVFLIETYRLIMEFLDTGGPVLLLIATIMTVMWSLIFERLLFFATRHRKQWDECISIWQGRHDRRSWYAHQIRDMLISRVNVELNRTIGIIRATIAVCPLLGLLGTVTGMIEVFEGMKEIGSGNARAMAGGISKAIIPTMAGMAGALSGLIAYTYIKRYADNKSQLLYDKLTPDV